jgi:hypothetical protein
MTRIPIAHIREQGQNIIIVPLDRSFEYKTCDEQTGITRTLQYTASSAGLAGRGRGVGWRRRKNGVHRTSPMAPFFPILVFTGSRSLAQPRVNLQLKQTSLGTKSSWITNVQSAVCFHEHRYSCFTPAFRKSQSASVCPTPPSSEKHSTMCLAPLSQSLIT